VDGDLATNADSIGGGELGELQDEIPGEVLSRFNQACLGS